MTLGLIVALVATCAGCYRFTEETVSGEGSVKEIKITRHGKEVSEICVSVREGVRLSSLVDLTMFEGTSARMSLDEAQAKFGKPKETTMQPEMQVPVSLYTVAKGDLGFMKVPNEIGGENQVWAFPKDQSPDATILDSSLRTQILTQAPATYPVRVHILRDVGSGGVTLNLKSNRINYIILGRRDGER